MLKRGDAVWCAGEDHIPWGHREVILDVRQQPRDLHHRDEGQHVGGTVVVSAQCMLP